MPSAFQRINPVPNFRATTDVKSLADQVWKEAQEVRQAINRLRAGTFVDRLPPASIDYEGVIFIIRPNALGPQQAFMCLQGGTNVGFAWDWAGIGSGAP